MLSSLSADTLLLSAGFPAVLLLYILDPNQKMLEFHARPLESKKHETKNRLAKPGQGMPVSTHNSRPRTPVVVARATRHTIKHSELLLECCAPELACTLGCPDG